MSARSDLMNIEDAVDGFDGDQTLAPRMMAGRCNDGGRDGGRKAHAVAGGPWGWQRALCGARPGTKTNGWGEWIAPAVTCPRCLGRMGATPRTEGQEKQP